jgi:hypothetical protein
VYCSHYSYCGSIQENCFLDVECVATACTNGYYQGENLWYHPFMGNLLRIKMASQDRLYYGISDMRLLLGTGT